MIAVDQTAQEVWAIFGCRLLMSRSMHTNFPTSLKEFSVDHSIVLSFIPLHGCGEGTLAIGTMASFLISDLANVDLVAQDLTNGIFAEQTP